MVGAPPPPAICRHAADAIQACLIVLLHFHLLHNFAINFSVRNRSRHLSLTIRLNVRFAEMQNSIFIKSQVLRFLKITSEVQKVKNLVFRFFTLKSKVQN